MRFVGRLMETNDIDPSEDGAHPLSLIIAGGFDSEDSDYSHVAFTWLAGCAGPDSHATRSLATDLDLALPLTVISMSRPSASKNRINRSIEKPDSFPCLSAETLG